MDHPAARLRQSMNVRSCLVTRVGRPLAQARLGLEAGESAAVQGGGDAEIVSIEP
jgi:hypothetical protein